MSGGGVAGCSCWGVSTLKGVLLPHGTNTFRFRSLRRRACP